MGIKDFQLNETVDFYALVKSSTKRETKTKKDYLALELSDASGTINGNLWDVTPNDVQTIKEGVVVHVLASVSSYKDALQLNFQQVQVAKDKNPTEFVERAPVDLEKVYKYLDDFISNIQNKNWKAIVEKIFEKYREEFQTYPAAVTVHHAYAGGLAFHTATMLRKGEALMKFYPWMNKELLCVGVLLHDVGKAVEMPGLFGNHYTTEGELLGHIEIILEDIVEICVQNDIDHQQEDILLLKHMIASHHGKLEWGTIAEPRIPEAAMLHMIDKMDAEMEQYRKIYDTLPKGEWSEKNFFLGNKRVYRPNQLASKRGDE